MGTDLQQRLPRWQRTLDGGLAGMFRVPPHFAEASVERDFLVDFGQRFAPFRRTAGAIGLLLWTVCFGWDYYHHHVAFLSDAVYPQVRALRAAGSLILLAMVALSFRAR